MNKQDATIKMDASVAADWPTAHSRHISIRQGYGNLYGCRLSHGDTITPAIGGDVVSFFVSIASLLAVGGKTPQDCGQYSRKMRILLCRTS